jgi:flagellar hook-length control protein FliK
MLNPAAPIANGPMAVVAAPGPAATGPDGGQAFSQALDQAAARQRDAAADSSQSGSETARARTDTPRPAAAEAADARNGANSRGNAARKASAAAQAADTAVEVGSALPGNMQAPPLSAEGGAVRAEGKEDEAPPTDLAAWVSSLPLPPQAPVAAAAAATGADKAVLMADDVSAAARGVAVAAARQANAQTPGAEADAPAAPTSGFAALLPNGGPRYADSRSAQGVPALAAHTAGHEKGPALGDAALSLLPQALRESMATQRTNTDPASVPTALSGLPATALIATQRFADSALPAQAEVQAPVGSHEFAPALGSQLSVMVRDGIDHAQLKLNPAEMGPIEVRISLDGTQAQVDFSAAHAATRQALQEAVPALASALRENGLTLTGGGVFEQARDQRGEAGQDGSRQAAGGNRRPLDTTVPPLAGARAPRARGVVDLYA